jgi:hypothetical protein
MPTTAQTFGHTGDAKINVDDFARKYPALSYNIVNDIAQKSGVDTSDPKAAMTVMRSRTFAERAKAVERAQTKKDFRIIERASQAMPSVTINPKMNERDALIQGATQQADILRQGMAARGAATRQLTDAVQVYEELANYNKDQYRKQRLDELAPTQDIDNRIGQLRQQALTAKTLLRAQVKNLKPELRNQVIASRMQVFADQMDRLNEVREARLKVASDAIDEEIFSKEDQIRRANSRVSALQRLIQEIEASGADKAALASLQIDLSKSLAALQKARAGAGNLTPTEDLIYQRLLDNLSARGTVPSATDKAEAKRQAQNIAREMQTRNQSFNPEGIGQFSTPSQQELTDSYNKRYGTETVSDEELENMSTEEKRLYQLRQLLGN